jgi:hypothetical protein
LQLGDWTSTGDTIDGNGRDGIVMDQSTLVLSGSAASPCSVSGNGTMATSNGISITNRGATLMLSGCVVLGNSGNGLLIPEMGTWDLGGGQLASPGGNTLSSPDPALRNGAAGVCYRSTFRDLSAADDHWSQCPPSQSNDCSGGIDIGLLVLGSRADTGGCLTP